MHIPLPTVLWLDASASDPTSRFRAKLSEHEVVQTFTDVTSCISYIESHCEQTIILIVSGAFGYETVSQIYELANVRTIFVFCASIKSHSEWAMDYCEKLMMFDHEDDLLQRLWSEVEAYLRELAKEYSKHADLCKERVKQLEQSCG